MDKNAKILAIVVVVIVIAASGITAAIKTNHNNNNKSSFSTDTVALVYGNANRGEGFSGRLSRLFSRRI